MKVGSLVYATDQGLGILARAFHTHGVVTHPMVIRHGRHPTHDGWYPGAPQVTDLRRRAQRQLMREFCLSCDVMLFFETPFDFELIPHCRRAGVKTALMPMYECGHQQLRSPDYKPDLFINPSLLDQQYYPEGVHLPVPVEVPWRRRERAEVFVHNAGHGGLKGRNGTAEVMEAMEHIRSPAKILIRSQDTLYRTANYRQHAQLTNPLTRRGQKIDYDDENAPRREKMCEMRVGTAPYESLWDEGQVFLFPEAFNGLSLPLQEARAAGMLVMAGDRFPMNTWLPREPLIPVAGTTRERVGPPYNEYDRAVYDPAAIAAKVDEWYGRDISAYSEAGREWAEEHSWERLGPRYREVLEGMLCG